MAINFSALGLRLKKKRIALGINQEKMAEDMSVTVGYISQVERGVTKLSLNTLSAISDYLKCSVTEILDGTDERSPKFLEKELEESVGNLTHQNRKVLLEISRVLEENQVKDK